MPDLKLRTESVAPVASTSLRIIATGIVLVALYYGSTVLICLICAIFMAFVLDPAVALAERLHVPRWLGALALVLASLGVLYFLIYLIYGRLLDLTADLPTVALRLKAILARYEGLFRSLGQIGSVSTAPTDTTVPMVRVQQESPWGQFLLRGIGGVYNFTVTIMFIPFLVFFMLTSKNHVWAATLNLFPLDRRQHAEDVIQSISVMVRRYVLGNALVALISALIITPVFALVGLPYAIIFGPAAAVLSLIPYLGVALAAAPPLLMSLAHSDRVSPFLAILGTVTGVHFLAVNVLTPKLVGHRVKLNALSVTLAMMFWGWLWGAVGLVLAVPITASFKAVCDNVRALRALGQWMGES